MAFRTPFQVRRLPLVRIFFGEKWNRSDILTAASVLVATAGLIVVVLDIPAALHPGKPTLEIVEVSAKSSKEVDSIERDAVTSQVQGRGKVDAPLIDITLKNTGSSTSVITGADFTFSRAVRLPRCLRVGGEVNIAATYDVVVPAPWGDPFIFYELKTPFPISRDMRFKIAPNDVERLAFSLGPAEIPEMSMPWLYELDVSLKHDGKTLHAARVSMLSNAGQDGLHDDNGSPLRIEALEPDHLRCLNQIRDAVRQATEGSEVKSSYLLEYRDRLDKFMNSGK